MVGFGQNNDDLLLCSCCGFNTITVTSEQQQAATFNPVNAAHFLSSRGTFSLLRDNWWRQTPHLSERGGGYRGKRRGQEPGWDVPACLNTLGEKSFLEFKVKTFLSNTWNAGWMGTNGIKDISKIKVQVTVEACRPLCAPPPHTHTSTESFLVTDFIFFCSHFDASDSSSVRAWPCFTVMVLQA